ncbi:MAG: TolC family protein [Ignavibacteria bacterium]|nr:TolC family protein [Ignavibacteria bacterium]
MRNILTVLCVFSVLIFANNPKDSITINLCIDLAIKNNPVIKSADATVELGEANFSSVRSGLLPSISFQSGVTKNGGTTFTGPTTRTSDYETYSLGFQGTQLIFDSWKSIYRLNAQSSLTKASVYDASNTRQSIIVNVQAAFYTYIQAKRVKDASLDMFKQSEEHLAQAKAFYEAGKKPLFDVLKGQSDLANSKLNYIRSVNSEKTARIQLENLTNTKFDSTSVFVDDIQIEQFIFPDIGNLDESMNVAINNRPDLLSALMKQRSNEALVSSAFSAHLPTLSATGGYFWRSFDLSTQFQSSWNAGVTLSIPIFQGLGLLAADQQAKANLKISTAQYESVLQSVRLDVEQQLLNLNETKERMQAAEAFYKLAEETLKLAVSRYEQEIGSPVEVTDAQVALLNAKVSLIQSFYDAKIAVARYMKAIGRL